MQRLIIALMAIGSLLMTNPMALRAQDDSQAVDPARGGPHAIDEPVTPPHTVSAGQAHTTEQIHVHGSAQSAPTAINGAATGLTPVRIAAADHGTHRVRKQHSWFGAQFALLLLGLLGAGFTVVAVPNAAKRVADHVSSNSKRDLTVGALVGVVMLVILTADAILLKLKIIGLLWAPVGAMVAFAPLLVLGFGWLAAMRCAGDCVARKMNRSGDGSTFGRMCLGLFAFFIANVLLGSLNRGLGVIGLCAEIAVALMGLGATAVIAAGSGFGRRA